MLDQVLSLYSSAIQPVSCAGLPNLQTKHHIKNDNKKLRYYSEEQCGRAVKTAVSVQVNGDSA